MWITVIPFRSIQTWQHSLFSQSLGHLLSCVSMHTSLLLETRFWGQCLSVLRTPPDNSWREYRSGLGSCLRKLFCIYTYTHTIGPRTLDTTDTLGLNFLNPLQSGYQNTFCWMKYGNIIIWFCSFASLLIGFGQEAVPLGHSSQPACKNYKKSSEENRITKRNVLLI